MPLFVSELVIVARHVLARDVLVVRCILALLVLLELQVQSQYWRASLWSSCLNFTQHADHMRQQRCGNCPYRAIALGATLECFHSEHSSITTERAYARHEISKVEAKFKEYLLYPRVLPCAFNIRLRKRTMGLLYTDSFSLAMYLITSS